MTLNDFCVQTKPRNVYFGRTVEVTSAGREQSKLYIHFFHFFLVEFYKSRNKKIKVSVKGFVDAQECHTKVSYINRSERFGFGSPRHIFRAHFEKSVHKVLDLHKVYACDKPSTWWREFSPFPMDCKINLVRPPGSCFFLFLCGL